MITKIFRILLLIILPASSVMAQVNRTEVAIISTIHGAHKTNPNYTYDSLFAFIDKFDPDIIGVEIRKEDIDSSVSYLKNNYPFEMYESISKYEAKKVIGFDWLGDDIAEKAIPENYWKEKSPLKKLQRKLSADSIVKQKLSITDIIQEEKNELALNASLSEINDGRYDLINRIYYEQLRLILQETEYKVLSDFYEKRDHMIADNILETIKENKGKKMIFLLGADHRDYTLKRITEELKSGIILHQF